jgi:ferrous iron transport protein B
LAIIVVVFLLSIFNSLGTDGSFGNENTEESVLSSVGKGITPVFQPMGIKEENWPATVGLFTGLFAKEVIVGTLNSLYSVESAGAAEASRNAITSTGAQLDPAASAAPEGPEAGTQQTEPFSLTDGIVESFTALGEGITGIFSGLAATLGLDMVGRSEAETAGLVEADRTVFTGMRANFNPASAYAYLLFVLLYFPCVAAFGTAIQEMGWKYGLLQATYLTILAWSTATLFYQLTAGGNPLFIALPFLIMTAVALFLWRMGRGSSEQKAEV